MSEFTVLIDSREGKPYTFEEYPVDTEVVTIETSDYVLDGDGFWNNDDTFIPYYGVERKSQGDFLNSITWERDRFRAEVRRADGWDSPMPIMVESPWFVFKSGSYYRDVNPNAIKGTVEQWADSYNCDFFFADDRADAERKTYNFLKWRSNQE